MEKWEWGVHEGHCCVLHGCKYGDKDCPVVSNETKQDYLCESCSLANVETVTKVHDLMTKINNLSDGDKIEVEVGLLKSLIKMGEF